MGRSVWGCATEYPQKYKRWHLGGHSAIICIYSLVSLVVFNNVATKCKAESMSLRFTEVTQISQKIVNMYN